MKNLLLISVICLLITACHHPDDSAKIKELEKSLKVFQNKRKKNTKKIEKYWEDSDLMKFLKKNSTVDSIHTGGPVFFDFNKEIGNIRSIRSKIESGRFRSPRQNNKLLFTSSWSFGKTSLYEYLESLQSIPNVYGVRVQMYEKDSFKKNKSNNDTTYLKFDDSLIDVVLFPISEKGEFIDLRIDKTVKAKNAYNASNPCPDHCN